MTIPFDTFDYAQKLEQAGVPEAQAAAQSKALAEVLCGPVATPKDLIFLERNVTTKIEAIELKLENKLAFLAGEMSILKWMTGSGIALSIAILVKSFVH